MLLVISVFHTCGYFVLYHGFRLHVYVFFYKIFFETVDFLAQINPVCSYCKLFCVCVCVCVCACVCVWECFVGIEKTGGPDVFVCSVVRYWPKTYLWIFLGEITFKRDDKILNLFQNMSCVQMRLKSFYSPPLIYFYSKLHGLSRARNESITEWEKVKKCKQRVTMLVFYAHFILKTQDL
jgi:hypothetical protein